MEQKIKISIADRFYSLIVKSSEEEEIMRKAVKTINDSVNEYKKNYSTRDIQDVLSMTILRFATILVKYEQKDEVGSLLNELKLLDKQLEEYIQSSDR